MNNKILTFVAGGLIALSASIGVGGALTATVGQKEAVEAEAVDSSTVSFNIGLNKTYFESLGSIYIHHWVDGGTETTWPGDNITSSFKQCEYDSTYMIARVSFTADHTKFIINNNKVQTNNLNVSDVTDDMKSNFGNAVGFLNFGTNISGQNGGHTRLTDSDYGPSQDTFRVFVKRNNNMASGYSYTYHYWGTNSAGEGVDVEYFRSGDVINYTNYTSGDDNYILAFDIPKEAIGCSYQFKWYNNTDNSCDGSSGNLFEPGASTAVTDNIYKSGYNAYLHYVYNAYPYECHMGITDNYGSLNYANLVPAIMEGYYTCSSDVDNGYGNAQQLYNTWFSQQNQTEVQKALEAVSIDDYASESDYASGTKTAKTNAWNKIQKMIAEQESAANATQNALNRFVEGSGTETAIATVAVLGSITLIGLAAFYYRRKRVR